MAIFSNQATLTYNGSTTNSNIVYGELLEVLTATKTAVEGTYLPGELVTYVVTLRNTGSTALSGLTISDDLGGYPFGTGTLYPLTYEPDSILVFANGIPRQLPLSPPDRLWLSLASRSPPAGTRSLSTRPGSTALPLRNPAAPLSIPSPSPAVAW